jgi:hypothetical protein
LKGEQRAPTVFFISDSVAILNELFRRKGGNEPVGKGRSCNDGIIRTTVTA